MKHKIYVKMTKTPQACYDKVLFYLSMEYTTPQPRISTPHSTEGHRNRKKGTESMLYKTKVLFSNDNMIHNKQGQGTAKM